MRAQALRLPHSLLVLAFLAGLTACDPSPRVTYDRDHCYLDDHAASRIEVDAQQSRLAQHVLRRQPIQTGVTVLMLLLAGAGYLDTLMIVIAARRSTAPRLSERVRLALERHRAHPVRYLVIVTAGLSIVGLGVGLYIHLDADRRASERALQQLQFCQLALRTADEQASLDEQRRNLDQLRETAGSIKSLVDTLPPDQQRKAEALLAEMKRALGNQDRMISSEGAVAHAIASGSAQIERDLGVLALDVGGLKAMPQRLHDATEALARIDERTRLDGAAAGASAPQTLGGALAEVARRTDALGARLADNDCAKARLPSGKTIGETLTELAARPPVVCRCEVPRANLGNGPVADGGARSP